MCENLMEINFQVRLSIFNDQHNQNIQRLRNDGEGGDAAELLFSTIFQKFIRLERLNGA